MVIPVQVGQGPELQCLNFSCWVGFLEIGLLVEELKITQEVASYVLLYTIDCFAIYVPFIYRNQGSMG